MTISDARFGAELVTTTGLVQKFDAVECLAAQYRQTDTAEVRSVWVTDFSNPGRLIPATEAYYLRSPNLRSPMGLNLSAFADRAALDAARGRYGGEVLTWSQVLAVVEADWLQGGGGAMPPGHMHQPSGGAGPAARREGGREHARVKPHRRGECGFTGKGVRPGARLAPGAVLLLLAGGDGAAAQVIEVSPTGPVRGVQEAVRLAPPGGRIIIRRGHYREPTIVVDKPVEIVGAGFPVLDGEGQRQILTIVADDVTVRGLALRNVGISYLEDRAAIMANGARGCRIEGNRLDNNYFGIYLAAATDCRVTGNEIVGHARTETSSGNGIHLWNSRRVVIEGNRVRGHRDGIYFEFVRDGDIRGNLSEHNLRYGLHFMFSDRCRYSGNEFRRNSAGVAVMYTSHVVMENNRFEENWGQAAYGLLLKDIDDSEIRGNTLRSNTVGIFADGSNRVRIEGNSFDVTTNSRRNYSTFSENYWAGYGGYDLDRDGFGDVPYYPVQLFSLLAEQTRPLLILLRSPFVGLLDAAERVLPVLTPKALADERPAMRPYR